MVKAVPDILARIVGQKRSETRSATPLLEAAAHESIAGRRDFAGSLLRAGTAIIAEIKKASPSRGVLTDAFDPVGTAKAYESGGAAALSVLTDGPNFQGRLEDLVAAREAVSLPALRKDFTIGEYDVLETAAAGADASLLIAAILDSADLRHLRELAATFRLAAIVEVHDEDELRAAIDSGAEMIGVNNRDLRTFHVDLETSLRLADRIPPNVLRVAESGIHSPEDVRRLKAAGYHAFLVGEHLMRSADPAAGLRALLA